MNDLAPLLLLWALGQKKGSSPASPPPWPSTASPPPPPPPPPMLPSAAPPTDAAPASDALDAASRVSAKVRSEAERVVRKNLGLKPKPKKPKRPSSASSTRTPAFLDYAPPDRDVSVADVQNVLLRRGYKSIEKNGVYGPKTELAWKALAQGKRLSPAIVRRSPKIARVNQETFTALSIP
jgi:hypothetical protein